MTKHTCVRKHCEWGGLAGPGAEVVGRLDTSDTVKREAMPERLLNDIEASDLLAIPTRRLVRMAKAGQIPAVCFPDGEFRFLPTDLTAFVQSHRRPATEVVGRLDTSDTANTHAHIGYWRAHNLCEAARDVLAWYDRDGSVGAADEVMERLRDAVNKQDRVQ